MTESRSPAAPPQAGWMRVDAGARDRIVVLNQVLFAGVALLAAVLAIALGWVGDLPTFILGLTVTLGTTGAAFVVPWNRLPHLAGLIVPVCDVIAIALLREATPGAALGILWAFPLIWIAWSYGWAGLVGGSLGTTAVFWVQTAIAPETDIVPATILLPVTITALAFIASLAARRASAQRMLLEKQSRYLQQAVDRARRQEDVVIDVLDALDFGVVRIAADGTQLLANEAHGRLQRARGRDGRMSAYAADGVTSIQADALPLSRARRGETFDNLVVWHGEPEDADRRAIAASARELTDPDGSAAGMVVVSRDVTSEELAIRAREDLVASVSHELRTPLTSIMGYLDLALDDETISPVARRSLEVAERNAGRLLELVADILTMSANARKGAAVSISPRPTNLAEVMTAAIEAATPRATERGITIDGSGVEDAVAYADAHRIRQVVDNLVSNAVKYNSDDGHVQVSAMSDGLHAWLTVSDDGPGISEHELPRLFERFFRSDSVRGSTTHGSGLGLAISRDIVRAHGGEITVQTMQGEGTTFIVRLPASDLRRDV
ncbi:sensor histidine kinase [Microbacterium sp. NPDC078428]|uniref:sensor histidine kinase n=1 Tax=Microbacterium sp. NPDC078428 TaxID=3364190 RepID=UPI0037C57B16